MFFPSLRVCKNCFFFFLLQICLTQHTFANKFGFDLRYECLGNCTYRVYVNWYFDCGYCNLLVTPPPPPPVELVGSGGCSTTLTSNSAAWKLIQIADVTPLCPTSVSKCTLASAALNGYAMYSWYQDFNLCGTSCNTFTIRTQTCCREFSLNSGANQGMSISNLIINPTQNNCNSSPVFIDIPHVYMLAGQANSIKIRAYDPDGDSLSYSLATCLGNSYTPITYSAGFSPTSPLGPNWTVTLSNDGILTLNPLSPNPTYTSAPICVEVTEWRNGFPIGSITRDFNCYTLINNNPPINTPPVTTLFGYSGVSASMQSSNAIKMTATATQTVKLSFIVSDVGEPAAMKLITEIPNDTLKRLNYGLSANFEWEWTPTLGDTGIYWLWFEGNDSLCVINKNDYYLVRLEVLPPTLTAVTTPTPCGQSAQGSLDLTVWVGTPPYSYLWSNGDTTEDISNLAAGPYTVMVTDSSGLNWSNTFYVVSTGYFSSNPSMTPTCTNTGGIFPNIAGGLPPFQYQWNTGATTQNLQNISYGGYSVNITDTFGCFGHFAYVLPPASGCFSTLKGKVFWDQNGNCLLDANEIPISNYLVKCMPSGYYVMTDSLGNYSFDVFYLGQYGLSPASLNNPNISLSCASPIQVNVSVFQNTWLNLNIPLTINPYYDVAVISLETDYILAASGRNSYVLVKNNSVLPTTAQVHYQHAPIVTPQSVSFATYNAVQQAFDWSVSLQSLESRYFTFPNAVQISTPLGSQGCSEAKIYTAASEIDTTNNTSAVCKPLLAAYDPNYKQVSPAGVTQQGYVPYNTDKFTYTVHFQNTGNWQAEYVVIHDTLDTDLETGSLEFIGASHPGCIVTIQDNVARFTFNHIQLPDSASDPEGSQGFVVYSLRPQNGLPAETELSGSAAIYFDFNPPVITNTVTNTLHLPAQIVLSDSLLCVGETLTANVQNGIPPYLWNGSVPDNTGVYSFVVNQQGSFTLHLEDAFAPVSLGYQVDSLLPTPAFSYQTNGSTLTLNPSGSYPNHLWDFGNGQTSTLPNPTVTYNQNGTYTLTLSVSNACGTVSTSQQISITGSEEELQWQSAVKFSPNPMQESTTFRFTNPTGETLRFTLWDMTGKVVRVAEVRGESFKLLREELAAGVYVWELKGRFSARGKLSVGE